MALGAIRRLRSTIILGADLFTIIGVFSGIYFVRLRQFPDYSAPELWLLVGTFLATLFVTGTYFRGQNTNLPRLPIQTFWICLVAGIICILWVYLLGPLAFNNYFGRGVLPVSTVLIGIVVTLIRLGVNRLYYKQEDDMRLLYLGYSESAIAFIQESENHSEIRSLFVLSDEYDARQWKNVKVLASSDIDSVLDQHWSGIIIDPNFQPDKQLTSRLISLRLRGVQILTLAEYYERHWYMVPVDHIGGDWFLHPTGFSMLGNPITRRIKRTIDILLSIVLIIVTAPLLLLCALLIKISSRGPILFKQPRVGYRGHVFTIYKLRTMVNDAENSGAQWAQQADPRVTRIGDFFRKSRLDELPQTWNVLKGEMSFVGPRPERPEFTLPLSKQIPYYDLRHMVKPGISGWAQVIFPYGASVEDALKKLQYELFYIKNQSLLLDLNIMIRTIFTVFQRSGR